MRVELTGFSQGVSLSNKTETVNYLDFCREDGSTFRIPITTSALEALMVEVYGDEKSSPTVTKEGSSNGHDPGGTEFGGDVPEEPLEEEPDVQEPPASEAEVPSL